MIGKAGRTAAVIVTKEATTATSRQLPWTSRLASQRPTVHSASSFLLDYSYVQCRPRFKATLSDLASIAERQKYHQVLPYSSSYSYASFSTSDSGANNNDDKMDEATTAGSAAPPQVTESDLGASNDDAKHNKRSAQTEEGKATDSIVSHSQQRNKKAKWDKSKKKEMDRNHTRRKTEKEKMREKHTQYDENVDERLKAPHEGSYANPAHCEKFGVKLERNLNPPTEGGDGTNNNEDEKKKLMKRKVALFLGFLGTKYGGFQVNVDQRTIQSEIELALYRAGLLSEFNFGQPHKYSWSSSARTDKGVHACAQVCSMKMELDPDDLEKDEKLQRETGIGTLETARQKLQSHLPEDICVLDLLRTTSKFCAKNQRDKARYSYMIPSFILHPECRSLFTEVGIPLDGRQELAKEPLSKDEVQKLQLKFCGYRSTPEQRELLQRTLSAYEGTHSFHNFTKKLRPGDASAKRYILEFRVQDPILVPSTSDDSEMEWIPTYVLGQSFLLHQIRKMISMAIDVTRGVAPLSVLTDRALSKDQEIRVALAPAQGLFLELSYFDGYNRRKSVPHQKKNMKKQQQEAGSGGEPPDLDWTVDGPARTRWINFRDKIREHIVKEEFEQGNFVQYLYQQECIFEYKRFYGLEGEDETKEDVQEEKEEVTG